MKKELLAVGISAVLVLVVFTSGCIDFGGEEKKKDTTAPIISEVSASSITSSGATITWTTNETSSSVVEYGTTTGYGSTATGTDDVTSHSVTLSGLSSGTTYHYGVKSADSSGNTATLGDYTFTTLSTEQPPIITMLELMDDYNPNTWSFKTYEPGTAVNIYDTVVNVSCVSTSYGEFTMVFFNWDSEEVPVAVEGNKTSEYPVGEAVTVYTPINEYNISGKKMTFFGYYEYFMYIYVSGFMTVYGGILLNSRFASSGNEKLVVATTDLYDSGYLDEYSVVLEKETFTDEVFSSNVSKSTVDNISSLTGWVTSSGEHITFRDANSNGFLDSGDCFIISLGNTSSEYIMDSYTLTLKRGEENETSAGLVLGYKGLFYSETYDEPAELTPMMALSSPNPSGNNYTVSIIAVSTEGPTISNVQWQIVDENDTLLLAEGGLISNGNSSMSNSICIYTYDYDYDGKLEAGDTLKIWDTGDKTIQAGWKLKLIYQPTGETMTQVTFQ
ncbi:MAG: fibronectin type III domain-containing protein [Candidatus Thermoplasmatota archaeon]|nr:fibronectin type III domain-containing protein [Candidatus Thermoplasmatota archaeon]MBU4256635.1 fibronectin type III domain-containing protein [Candidatus Thermoplasmatota archaeon]MCG2826516.1 fibronectin type III domain-containing protein [Thermoplasmatales archaeon]